MAWFGCPIALIRSLNLAQPGNLSRISRVAGAFGSLLPMPLTILYQDQWLVCIDKPSGMLVHPGRDPEPSEQIAMKVLRDHLGHLVYPIHRLDRPTSGVLLFACDRALVAPVKKQFDDQSIKKSYIAVVPGESPREWTSLRPLQKDEDGPFQTAETHFCRDKICEIQGDCFSVLSVFPKTGRYHQIRRHLAADGFPIVGDYLYGDEEKMNDISALIGQPRLMLHARELTFFHPIEGVEVTEDCSLPSRFAPFLGSEILSR